ncbi:hypothetical protein AAFM46_09085 [Arthrobacter sp. TMP15]|uniref:hypothetical protein n=1 Tax=Arthrobacter sp. TMP15 TaxID=3140789 RepID=UPI0031BA90D7
MRTDTKHAGNKSNSYVVAYLFIGVAAAIAGFLPWLVTGMRLPLQNLWATSTPPGQMPISLLPFSQYMLTLIAGLIITGSAIAGGILRLRRSRLPRFGATAAVIGLLGVQLAATLQASLTVSAGLLDNQAAELYLSALLAGTIASIMVGVLVLFLISRAPASGAVIGASFAAVALAPWLRALLIPLNDVTTSPNSFTLGLIHWFPAVVVGLAIAWSVSMSTARLLAAGFSLIVLWFGPALFAAISIAAGSRVLAYQPAGMAKLGASSFLNFIDYRSGSLAPLVVAAAIATAGSICRSLFKKFNRSSSVSPA